MDHLVAQWRGIKDQRTHWAFFSFIQGAVERRQNKEFRCNLQRIEDWVRGKEWQKLFWKVTWSE